MSYVNIHEKKYFTETLMIIACIFTHSMIILDLTFDNEYIYQYSTDLLCCTHT
jgi:hypothetical protein